MVASNDVEKYALSSNKTNRFRRILPQVIAATVKSLHTVDWGLILAMPTIIIPSLTGIPNDQNRNEFLTMNGAEASWIASITMLTQILGSLVTGVLTDRFGRKRLMIFVNIPFAIGWLILFQATQVWHIIVGFAMHGLAIGLMESSVFTYIEPSTRGVLTTYTNVSFSLGIFIVSTLNAWIPWRNMALVCLAVPVTCAITICFIPETPQWLLSKQRTKQAQKSLRWLRGWVSEETITHEFNELQRHSERSNSCNSCIKQDLHYIHPPPSLSEKCAELKRRSTLKPFSIIIVLYVVFHGTGSLSIRPFIVQISKAYESPIPSDETVILFGVISTLAQVTFMCLIRFTGKRRIYLTMLLTTFISLLTISCYGFICLPNGFNSFDQQTQSFHLENRNLAYIPTICLYVWHFCTCCSIIDMPLILLSELYPLKIRVLASGITASINYAMGFISKKTYYDLETTLSLPGTSLLYCVIVGVGLILTYFILPETEGRTLLDIERHFLNNSKKLTDRKITKTRSNFTDSPDNQHLLIEMKHTKIVPI